MADIQSNIRVNIDTNGALSSLKVLQGQISAFHQEMSRSGALAASEMNKLQNSLMNSLNRSGQFDARMKTIKTTTESFTEALEKNKLSMGQYFRYAGAATKDFGKLFKGEFDTIEKVARERVKDLQTQYIKMGRDASGAMRAISVRPLMLDLEDLGTKTQIAAQKQQLLNQLIKQGSTNMLNWGKNTQWAGRQLMVGFTVPLTMLGQIASKTFMDMEQSVLKFQRVYGDLSTTSAQTKEMTAQVTDLAKAFTKYGVAVSDTVGMAADAAAMGKQGADLLAQVESASRLSVLGGIDQKKALETTISLTNAFGIAADQLKNKINFLNVVENQTVTSIDDLTIAIPKAAPVIKQLGGNVEDLAFFLTAMKEGGINASEGANALKSGLASIINPTKKASDMLNGFGINIKGIVNANKGDVKGMVMGVAEALNKLDPLKRAQAIEQLFGKFQFARISTLFKNITDVNSQASKVSELAAQGPGAAAVLAQREMKKIEESPMFKFKKALEDLKVELIPLGEQFLKAVTPIAKFFTDVLKNFNNMSSGAKDFIGGITMVVAGIGPVALMVIGLIANGIANMIKMFASVKSFFNNLGKGTRDLGSQTAYMTQEQIDAAAVAASLEQTHSKLKQTFTAEASAIALLRSEMEKTIAKQKEFGWTPGVATPTARRTRKKFAAGGMVVGPGGPKDDLVPTDLSNGEAVIDAETVKKNPRIISALFAGRKINIPGYAKNNSKSFSLEKYDAVYPGLSSLLKSTSQALGGILGDIVRLANTTHEIAGRTPGASSVTGANAAHGNPRMVLSVDQTRAAGESLAKAGAGGRVIDMLKTATKYRNEETSAFSNLTFPMPRAANLGSISGQDLSGWVKEDPKRFMSMIAKNENIDPNDPGLKEFALRVASMMEKAGSKAITESDFENIIAKGIEQQAEGAAKTALINARDTYQTFNVTNDSDKRARREFVPKGFGINASGEVLANTGTSAYGRVRQRMASSGEWGAIDNQSNDFIKGVIASKIQSVSPAASEDTTVAKTQGKKTAKAKSEAYDAGLIEEGQVQSPSRKTKEIGANYGKGFIIGAQEGLSKPIVSPAAAQHARDQVSKILKPYTDPTGLINMTKLNAASQVRVRLITQEEKDLRAATQMLVVSDRLMAPFRDSIEAIGNAAFVAKGKISEGITGVKNFAAKVPTMIGSVLSRASAALKSGVETMKAGISSLAQRLVQVAKTIGKGVIGQLGSGKAMMATAAVMGTLSMMPGKVGEIANAILMPLMMIQSIIALIPETLIAGLTMEVIAPIAAIAAPIVLLGGLIAYSIWQNSENNKKAAAFGNALAVSSESVKKFGEVTGRVGITEAAQAQTDARLAGLGNPADLQFGKQYVGTEQGKADVENLKTLMSESQMTPAMVAQQYTATLAQAITQGTLTLTEANSIAAAVGKQLGSSSFAITVSSKLTELLGPDGTDILKDPLEITTRLIKANTEASDYLAGNAFYTKDEEITARMQHWFNGQLPGSKDSLPEGAKPGDKIFIGGKETTIPTEDQLPQLTIGNAGDVKDMGLARAAYTAQLGSYGSIQTTIDSGLAAIDKKIEAKRSEAESESDPTKKSQLQRELSSLESSRDDDRRSVFSFGNAQRQKQFILAEKIDDKGTFEEAVNNRKEKLTDETEKTVLDQRKNDILSVTNTDLRSLLEGGLLSNSIGALDSKNIIDKSKEGNGLGENFSNAYLDAVNNIGDRQATELTSAVSMLGAGTKGTTDILKNSVANGQGYEAALKDTNVMKMDLSTQDARQKLMNFATEFTNTKKKLQNIPETRLVAKAVSDKKVQKLIEDSEKFKGLNKQQKITYLAKYNASMKLEGDPSIQKAWKDWSAKQGANADTTFPAFARYLAGEAATAETPKTPKSQDQNTGTAPTKTDKANAALSILGRQEEKINKAYDERLKALDAIQKANERINQQKKDQLDLADALSKGDIGAAARAQQQARQNAMSNALQDQRDQMNAARDAQIASLRVNGMSRLQLEAFTNKEANKADWKTLGKWSGAKGYAIGGMVKPQYFADGGDPKGTDTIAAMLTPGEFVVKKSAVDKIGLGTMHKINNGELPTKSSSVYNYSISVNVKSDADADQIANVVLTKIQAIDDQSVKGNEA